jgi:hypothetical protein
MPPCSIYHKRLNLAVEPKEAHSTTATSSILADNETDRYVRHAGSSRALLALDQQLLEQEQAETNEVPLPRVGENDQ